MATHDDRSRSEEELYVVELDERLEFGAAIIDSDLEADDNSGCNNDHGCTAANDHNCTNSFGKCTGTNSVGKCS